MNGASTIGSFYAAALRSLGANSVQDKQLKAEENTAKNTKRTVQLLETLSNKNLAFI